PKPPWSHQPARSSYRRSCRLASTGVLACGLFAAIAGAGLWVVNGFVGGGIWVIIRFSIALQAMLLIASFWRLKDQRLLMFKRRITDWCYARTYYNYKSLISVCL
ncbi:MAG: hypothetical protein JJU02_10895, partial [Cryomorphaceae bacterium]|nr:hypothetical protein [Cryomorphaceae bacterium]